MKRTWFIIVLLLTLVLPAAAMAQSAEAQKDKGDELNLDRIADDLKFSNGMQFVNLKQYEKAIEVLGEYLEVFNDGTHRHEAYRQIADIYCKRYDYQKAVRTYRQLFEEFSTTDDGVEAYFHMGICYAKMGYDAKAAEIFQEIADEYPDSSFAQQSKLQMDLLNTLR